VYGLGELGTLDGLIYPDIELIDEMPPADGLREIGGVDFGFHDPTAIVRVLADHGRKCAYIDEIAYQREMRNGDITAALVGAAFSRATNIWADAAEPKSIAELRNLGLWVVPSVKGADSINSGIDTMRRYPINVTRRSVNISKEMKVYKFKVDRDGNATNKPIDKFNHAMDAARYVATDILTTRRSGTARYRNTYLYNNG
jgi:phage terminase large subunit